MKLRPFFAWFDCWIGWYWSADTRTLYLCPLPMIGVAITLAPAPQCVKWAVSPIVELHPASWWHCPICDREHFARLVRPSLTDEDYDGLLADKGLSRDEIEGQFLMAAEEVECAACRLRFETRHDNDLESEAA